MSILGSRCPDGFISHYLVQVIYPRGLTRGIQLGRVARRSHHGPFGKDKKSRLNLLPFNARDPKYGRVRLEVAGWQADSR
jgi:hypothetical protein